MGLRTKTDTLTLCYRLLFTFFLFPPSIFSWQSPLSAGVHVSGGVSRFSTKTILSSENQPAWTIGSELNWRVNDWFSFEPGLQYSFESRSGSVSLPLISKVSFTLEEIEPYVFIGPYFSVISAKAFETMRAIDFGSLQGIGCFIPVNYRWALNIDLRLKIGTIDLDTSETVALRTRTLQLNVGVAFPI